ncbi:hypothetical protein RHMOL_Rhmol01G0227600 [Rhododendron molle]|uniref:Uncharacterized protein n=1 Tax=Rhododendron molle TaxID=49168 RepID=A0ACC0Q4P4_RHOML|nr:hypothetical protein RHMOL_Rhmol01G0227600 [Rhododendron molle]
MEAMTAVTVAGLTVYDMCKAASKDIQITDAQGVEKTRSWVDVTGVFRSGQRREDDDDDNDAAMDPTDLPSPHQGARWNYSLIVLLFEFKIVDSVNKHGILLEVVQGAYRFEPRHY